MNLAALCLLIAGALAIVAGISLVYIPAGLIAAGLALGAGGYLLIDIKAPADSEGRQ